FHVTGVQTCALPIYLQGLVETQALDTLSVEASPDSDQAHHGVLGDEEQLGCDPQDGLADGDRVLVPGPALQGGAHGVRQLLVLRSEERRVGKGCTSG